MLVWLAEYLVRYETAFNAISYITVRAILALLTALFIYPFNPFKIEHSGQSLP